jgi:sugar phosphate isomerase/epimerase
MYSLRDDIGRDAVNIDSVIVKIGEIGYKYVESASYNNGLIYGMEPETFKAKTDAAGLTALSCHVRQDIIADSVALWAWWDKCIDTHKRAGMKYIVMPSMPTPETKEGLQAYCDYYNQVGEKCNAAGLKFGYHNHSYEFEKIYEDQTVMYEYLVQNTDPEKVFFELDVYWAIMGKHAPVELFEKYPGRFKLLHIKDHKELGVSGFVGFDAIFNNLEVAGTEHVFVEVESYNFPPVESVKQSLDYLNNADFVK